MDSQVFITQGDITRICADAVAVTRGTAFASHTENFARFAEHADGDFHANYEAAKLARKAHEPAFWVPCSQERAPHGVVYVSAHNGHLGTVHPQKHPAYLTVKEAIAAAVPHLREIEARQH